MNEQINQLIRNIYRAAYATPVSEFKRVCFDLLANTLNIQSGTWITRSEQTIRFYESDSFTYQLPTGFMEDYHHLSTVSEQVNQVFSVVLGHQRKTLDILDVVPEDEWYGSDMYRLYCDKFNLHHSLMTVDINPINQVMNLVTLARHNQNHHFSEEDKRIKEFLFPNLIEALRISTLNAIHQGKQTSTYRAVLDRYGNIIEAEDSFIHILTAKGLIEANKLLIELKLKQSIIEIDELKFFYENHDGLVFIELDTLAHLKQMGRKKLQVCQLLIEGKTNKEIAKLMNISPNTVNNHLKAIYKILGVDSRHKVIAQLHRLDF